MELHAEVQPVFQRKDHRNELRSGKHSSGVLFGGTNTCYQQPSSLVTVSNSTTIDVTNVN
ncbi:MAG: hypothetical protein QOH96_2293 [Blastocatellia bacterium]|jgi:hypothetical protein|nr:hypothetical protein [Blastocatellia bacterium]